MVYGYLRVSTNNQDLANQESAILAYANDRGLGRVEFISETISTTKRNREIYRLVERLRDTDHLVIYELSRLARSMSELESIRVRIADKGATIHAISQNLVIEPNSDDITSKALIFALELSAQLERQMISDRTKNALRVRRDKGLPLGRPAGKSRLDAHRSAIIEYRSKGVNVTAISKIIGCNRQTLTNWLNLHKNEPGIRDGWK